MSKVLGLGNALVDLIFEIGDDRLLDALLLPKGSMTLVDSARAKLILDATKSLKCEITAGGSASNTIDALANLGIECGYIGKIGKDVNGELFTSELVSRHITPRLLYGINPTGTAITLLSKDAERTFATYLGAAIELGAEDLKEDFFRGYSFCHIEGYLVQNHALILKAVQLARAMNLTISIDMASYNIVAENREFLSEIIRDYVDIVFANEEEARVFTNESPEKAARVFCESCSLAIVKVGKNGSFVQEGENLFQIPSIRAELRDTTGAGDLYAAGFIYGLIKGYDLNICGRIGSLLGGKAIEVYGARLSSESWSMIHEAIELIVDQHHDI